MKSKSSPKGDPTTDDPAGVRRRLTTAASIALRKSLKALGVPRLYERMLWNQVQNGPIPEHIGIILDGNRRWAKRRGLDPWKGHAEGARKVEDFLDWCGEIEKIRTITLYAFSTENFRRTEKEVCEVLRLLKEYLQSLLKDERIRKNEIRVKVLGRVHLLPEELQELIRQVEANTAHYQRHYFNFAVAYGGRTEIVDAVTSLARDVRDRKLPLERISEKTIENYLYTAHLPKCSPDLIIRTSGEVRLSNFLTWQGAYSELCFVDVFWPDFRKLDLLRAIRMYQKRQRRFGG
jgi:tritrans,polycis-undecaprenyl-diphosphate synthase [geranylgeranyl-diphosphate specific]